MDGQPRWWLALLLVAGASLVRDPGNPGPARHDAGPAVSWPRPSPTREPTLSRYGTAHQRERARHIAGYRPGQACALCAQPMHDRPSRLDLAHNEAGTGYLGLAHRRCNRGAAGALTDFHGRRKPGPDPDPIPWSGW
jgi:hypothetical protein